MTAPLKVGAFELVRPLGEGGMGIVWAARHLPTGAPVAVKTLRPEVAADETLVRLVEREIRAAAALDHPHVVRLFDQGAVTEAEAERSGGALAAHSPYLVMELLEGGDLNGVRGRIEWPALRGILYDVLLALGHAHARGVLHRDLKPGNVLLDGPIERLPAARLTDFGIARVLPAPDADADHTVDGFYGTPSYAPLEQVLGPEVDVGPWTDLYALGGLGWALATGRPPFRAKTMAEALAAHKRGDLPPFEPNHVVPRRFHDWLAHLLQPRIEDRFESAAEAASALLELDAETPMNLQGSEPSTLGPRPVPPLALGLGLFGIREPPVIGRRPERTALMEALRDACDRRSLRVVLLQGGAGAGKSRLGRWVCELAAERGRARVLRVAHLARGGTRHGLGPALERLLRTEGLERLAAMRRLRRRLPELGLEAEGIERAVMDLLRPGREGDSVVAQDPLGVTTSLLGRLAAERPLLLFLDDLEYGAETLAIVGRLLDRGIPEGAGLLVVGALRDDLVAANESAALALASFAGDDRVRTLALGPLAPREVRRLVERTLRVRGDVVQQIVDRADGSPLYAIQIVADLVARGLLVPTPAGLGLPPGATVQLPDDVRRLWRERVTGLTEDLGADEREALELAATLGRGVDRAEWERACVEAGIAVPHGLPGRLARRGLLTEDDAGFRFVHAQARDAVEEQTRERRGWRLRCSACADAIAAVHPGPWTAARRGCLLAEAGRFEDAFGPLLSGAEMAGRRGRAGDAEALLDQAVEALEAARIPDDDARRGLVGVLRIELLRLQGRHARALVVARQVVADAEAAGWRTVEAQALGDVAVMTRMTGDVRDALVIYEAALELKRQLGDRTAIATSLASWSQALIALGRLDDAEAALAEAATLVDDNAPEALQRVLVQRGRLTMLRGDPAGAIPILERGIEACRASGSLHSEAQVRHRLAQARSEQGDLKGAEREVREMLALASLSGHPGDQSDGASMLGDVLLGQGRTGEAEEAFRVAIAASARRGSPWVGVPRTNLAQLLLKTGRPAEAIPLLESARGSFETLGRPPLVACADGLLLAAHALVGDRVAAKAVLDRLPPGPFEVADTAVVRRTLGEAVKHVTAAGDRPLATRIANALARVRRSHIR